MKTEKKENLLKAEDDVNDFFVFGAKTLKEETDSKESNAEITHILNTVNLVNQWR
jgi:hypothetical protein